MHKIEELIKKYNSGQCSTEERALLEQWYQSFEWSKKGNDMPGEKIEKLREEVWLAFQNTKEETRIIIPLHPKKPPYIKWWPYAAAAVIIVLTGVVLYFPRPSKQPLTSLRPVKMDAANKEILPGTSKAQLVLGDGSIISLDSSKTMQLTEKDGTKIDKVSGKLVYNDTFSSNKKVLFNILSTPRGGEYQLELHDGTKVWLNAASSLRFPTRFEGNDRTVFLHGEAYFEVAKNAKMPFRVKLEDEVTVEVIGTHFNIMGYGDENEIRTTLEEGMVKVTSHLKTVSLPVSKQAVMKKSDQSLVVSNANVEKALAWKNGRIEFDDDDLPYIMRQLSRWYDVDINFTGDNPSGKYQGVIRRTVPLSNVLEILKAAGVKFKMEGKKVTVTDG
ncbi:MAG: FecR family protein [Chitinophagaceae bacterium]